MQFHILDTVVLVAFFALVLGTSLYKSRREKTSEDYFLAGRKWYLMAFRSSWPSRPSSLSGWPTGRGNVGLAVSGYQLLGAVTIVFVAIWFLPRFLRAGIYTMPESRISP
jgi:SSS family solute:Na+ symporter